MALEHKIYKKGIEVDMAKIATIEKLPLSTSVQAIWSFLGHVGFYRLFILDFAKITKPLMKLLEKDVLYNFTLDCLLTFTTLKNKLIKAPIMIALDWSLPFELMCDTSDNV